MITGDYHLDDATAARVLARLRAIVATYRTQSEAARALGTDTVSVNRVLRARARPGRAIADRIEAYDARGAAPTAAPAPTDDARALDEIARKLIAADRECTRLREQLAAREQAIRDEAQRWYEQTFARVTGAADDEAAS